MAGSAAYPSAQCPMPSYSSSIPSFLLRLKTGRINNILFSERGYRRECLFSHYLTRDVVCCCTEGRLLWKYLNEQAANLLSMGKLGLIFNFDLLGYGIMALSTFFTGLSMKAKNKADKWLKALMMIHGVFYFSCTFMPITGMFVEMSSGGDGLGGRLALVAWCVYFLPIGILSFLHFRPATLCQQIR